MTKWEYRNRNVDHGGLEAVLAEMGLDGWELVTAHFTMIRNSEEGPARPGVIMIFKRPLSPIIQR